LAALSLAALVATCLAACSSEGEGQRCSPVDDQGGGNGPDASPGSSDCAQGLYCYAASSLGGEGAAYAAQAGAAAPSLGICCPPNRSASDPVTVCAAGNPAFDAGSLSDAAPLTDAHPPADATVDALNE